MARVSLSKASMSREQRQLKSYRQFLPSLDLKRRQLIAERAKANGAVGMIPSGAMTRNAAPRRRRCTWR